MAVFLCAIFIFEEWLTRANHNKILYISSMLLTLVILVTSIKSTRNYSSLAFFIPFVLFLFYTVLMMIGDWSFSQYFIICFAICGISCLYSNFNSTTAFIVVQNIIILLLVLMGNPVAGRGVRLVIILINWVVFLFADIILLTLTRSATIVLDKALMQQNSFMNLLASTENYVAIVDEHNKVLYASKTLSQLGMVEEQTLAQGRPLIDLFPGRSLKVYAGKMLDQKGDYAEDWEFSLNGQKRYFKAASHSLPGYKSGTLINLYDMTHLAERDEIAVMKDSMKIGLFFMDKNNIIQDHYSRYLEEMLSETNLFGKVFTDMISGSVTPNELQNIKDYFEMVINHSFDQEMLDDINPLNELHYTNTKNGVKKVFQCGFATVERGRGETFILVTVYDITLKVELQKKLQEEQSKRQEEMQSVFELIQVDPGVFDDFMKDMEYEFDSIDKVLKDKKMSNRDTLVKTYQSIHAIKSNAVILGLNVFGNKVHALESLIKKLREQTEEVPFNEMLNLTMEIEKLSTERESFKMVIEKLKSYTGSAGVGGRKQNVNVLIESLAKTVDKAAADMGRKIRFVNEVDATVVEMGPRRVIKEILMQLIRNSVAHGIEPPQERIAKGKNETGIIKLTIKLMNNIANIELRDDGRGLDYKKIAEKAIRNKIIRKEDAANKDMLIKAIFSPGFSTAENEGMHAGRGIGLNLVRDRIKEVRGAIKLRSEPNKGTLFLITIPIERRKPRTPQ
jgi:two-component system chemotaxis sensor kinase CheA